jgi:hypothetical protein
MDIGHHGSVLLINQGSTLTKCKLGFCMQAPVADVSEGALAKQVKLPRQLSPSAVAAGAPLKLLLSEDGGAAEYS